MFKKVASFKNAVGDVAMYREDDGCYSVARHVSNPQKPDQYRCRVFVRDTRVAAQQDFDKMKRVLEFIQTMREKRRGC